MHFFQTVIVVASALTASCMTIKRQSEQTRFPKRDGWTSLGCYTDNVSGRALTNGGTIPGGSSAMTNMACQTACSAAGFSYAGTEYGSECWCGNSIANGGELTSDGCNMPCNGNSADMCGGPNRLTVYQMGGGSATTPNSTTPPMTTSSTTAMSTTAPGSSSGIKSMKRGLSYDSNNMYGDATLINEFKGRLSWAYDWTWTTHGLDSSFEFVPMLWGLPTVMDQNWAAAASTAKEVLGFNEPDLTYEQSSNMLPEAAALGYKNYILPAAGSARIGGPGVLWNNWNSYSSGGPYSSRVWTQYFLGNCTDCRIDFAPIHYYQDCNPASGESGSDWFIANVTNAWETLKLPIWITEFQCYGSDQQQADFLTKVLPWLDSQDYVERYAYFGAFPNFTLDAAGTAFSLAGMAFVS